jgi:hypothetical protein
MLYINLNIDLDIFRVGGFSLRYYSVMFLLAQSVFVPGNTLMYMALGTMRFTCRYALDQ